MANKPSAAFRGSKTKLPAPPRPGNTKKKTSKFRSGSSSGSGGGKGSFDGSRVDVIPD
jgi:hypothetical protein